MTGPAARVDADVADLLGEVREAFVLGEILDWSILTTGYEDCNIDLSTSQCRVVVKVFAAERAPGMADRTAGIITRAQHAGVVHPQLHRDRHGSLVHHAAGHQVLVMDYVPGRTVYELQRAPTRTELAALLDQAAQLHTLDDKPEFVFDPWAITNLRPLAAQVHEVLDTEQHDLVHCAIDAASTVDRQTLPAGLIHADLTQGNVLVTDTGVVTVLDFAVANRAPRVQELAVVAANLTHHSPQPLPNRVDTIAELYTQAAPEELTSIEHHALHAYAHAAAAMELLGALAEWHHGNHSAETHYLIGLGLTGLRDYATVS